MQRFLQNTETKKTANFFETTTTFIETTQKILKQNKKLLTINVFNKYKNINQRKFNTYVYKIQTMFEIKFIMYLNDKQKILYTQNFFERIFAND